MPPYKTDWTQDTLLHLRDMKQAQVSKWGEAPKCVDVAHPGDPKQGEVQLKVIACSVHALVRSRAAGTHYSAKSLPHIPGTDGVGRTSDGKLVYFNAISDTGGSMTEVINIAVERTTPIPDGADPVQVAGLLNPVSASWMALSARTHGLAPGFTALILGATGVSGSAAVEVARALGASKVVGAARSAARLSGLGLDGTIELANDPSQTDWSHAMEVDVVLDFIYGPATVSLFRALKPSKPVQYVQIGAVVSPTVDFPADLLRSKDITLRGAGPGAWQMKEFSLHVPKMVEAITLGTIRPGKFQEIKLSEIEAAWDGKGGDRIIFTI